MDDDDENEITPLDFLEAVYPQSKPSAEYADARSDRSCPVQTSKAVRGSDSALWSELCGRT